VMLERSGMLLRRAMAFFRVVASTNANPVIQAVQGIVAPKLVASSDAIYLNEKLFARVEAVYTQRDALKDPEARRLTEDYYRAFVHAGANLSEADKGTLRKLNEEEAVLINSFKSKLLGGTKESGFGTEDVQALAGLSQAKLSSAVAAAREKGQPRYWIPLQAVTQQPLLAELSNRDTRRALFEKGWNRTEHGGNNDSRQTIARIAKLRALKGKLLGYANYAEWKIENQMAKSPEAVLRFINRRTETALDWIMREVKDIQNVINSQAGGFPLAPWDWKFYSEQMRKSESQTEEEDVTSYFEFENVLRNGVFYTARQLYGISFTELSRAE